MKRDDTVYLCHMLDMAKKISYRVADNTKADFDADEDPRYVIAHLVQTIGEAAARVSKETRDTPPKIP